jgi:hypothetical protein
MLPTRSLRVAIVALVVVLAACGDPTKPKAFLANALSTYVISPFTGAPVTAATAISFLGGASRASSAFNFDVAFDLDASGRTLVYPVRSVGGALANLERAYLGQAQLTRVGLQIVPGPFESVTEVPTTGYDTLSIQTIAPGAVMAVNVLDPSCAFSLGGTAIAAKMTVDSVNASTRKIYLRTVVDPNCGYVSVVPDSIPTH